MIRLDEYGLSSAFTSPLRLKDVDAMSDSSADAKLVNALIREVALNGGSVVAGRMLQLRQGMSRGCESSQQFWSIYFYHFLSISRISASECFFFFLVRLGGIGTLELILVAQSHQIEDLATRLPSRSLKGVVVRVAIAQEGQFLTCMAKLDGLFEEFLYTTLHNHYTHIFHMFHIFPGKLGKPSPGDIPKLGPESRQIHRWVFLEVTCWDTTGSCANG